MEIVYTPKGYREFESLHLRQKSRSLKGLRDFFFCRLFVDFFPVGAAKEIVHADLIKVSQGTEYMRRDHPLSAFIISICPLGNIDCCSHLRLREVVIFPQVTDPVVLFHTHHQEKYKLEQFVLLTF